MFWLPRNLQREYEQLQEQHGQRGAPAGGQWESETSFSHPDEADLLAEAKLLRQHKGRLEARMHILEEHNKQLESQLHRLRQLLHQVMLLSDSVGGTVRRVTARRKCIYRVGHYRNTACLLSLWTSTFAAAE